VLCVGLLACSSKSSDKISLGSHPVSPPAPSCSAAQSGSASVAVPTLQVELSDSWHEGWLASPAVADLDGDGAPEIVVARAGRLLVFHADGSQAWHADVSGRIWASPVVADLLPSRPGLEVAVAARGVVHLYTAGGSEAPGFPVTWRDELRALAAGDIDGDGQLELVAVTTSDLDANGQTDIVVAWKNDGRVVPGFPPNTTGHSGCDDACYVHAGFDQTLALGDVNGDGIVDVFAPQDNAYMSLHDGTGRAFDANPIFRGKTKFLGVRFLLDYTLAQQGYSDHEDVDLQAHFTNSAPAIADLDGDGNHDLIVLGSVQNTSQDDRERGVVLFALHNDGTRLRDWVVPYHAPDFLSGLWDFDGTNVVAATNQVSVADLFADAAHPGPELVFAGFDGRIHCVDARGQELWNYQYTTRADVLTAGVAIADLSGDGAPEIVFSSYSTGENQSHLFVLDGGGNPRHQISLPGRGSMAVPTVATVDADPALEIVVPLKDSENGLPLALVYEVAGSSDNCLPWPTGRANLHRNGYVP
jgi:hypothetical protein